MYCPACNSANAIPVDGPGTVYTCGTCGALYGSCYLGDSYHYVLPCWDDYADTPAVPIKYYDLDCWGSKGLVRRHGWYNPETKKITQTG